MSTNKRSLSNGHDNGESSLIKKPRGEYTKEQIEHLVHTIRILSADMVETANSGHPGAPMGCAPIAHVLFSEIMQYSPKSPKWFNRDRFVLSNGHSCALLYSMLHLTGYDLSIEDLKKFRQLGSITPGHPENFLTPGVEVSTGPLGQGITNAVGLAIAEKHLSAVFNQDNHSKIIDHFTYVLCGDGCLQEGISSEASSLAGHLGLGKLIVCYDDNKITIDGDTALSFTEDVGKRYEAYNWQVITVPDGNDIPAIRAAIEEAKLETNKPSLIKIRTVIGYGSTKEGTGGVHGAPLGKADLSQAKQRFGFDPNQSFVISEEAYQYYNREAAGKLLEESWNKSVEEYSKKYPALAADLHRRIAGQLPEGLEQLFPVYDASKEVKAAATRNRSEEVLNSIASALPELIGGSADLTPSNLTLLKCSGDFQRDTPQGRYIRFGVREHAMAAICNGISAHGGLRPYCATFLNFIGYALGAVRVSALSKFPVLYIMTHDSIGLGEDGPTHQPCEMLQCLRATPNLLTIRPADGNETAGAYLAALTHDHTPTVISLSRQGCPTLPNTSAQKVQLGGYVLDDFRGNASTSTSSELPSLPTITLVSTGTELSLAVKVAKALIATSSFPWVRVVSLPCTELFDQQSLEYQQSVFLAGSPILSIEASSEIGWRGRYAHAAFGIPENSYGLSAPGDDIYKHFGFTVENLVEKSKDVVAWFGSRAVPNLFEYPRIVSTPKSFHH